jgi:hypothetical protein
VEDCCCSSLPDLAIIPMGGDGLDERVFSSLERVLDHGGHQWWLYLSKCAACGQAWMVAQEERIFDSYFLRRLDRSVAHSIAGDGRWPAEFCTYEAVLKIGTQLGKQWTFDYPLALSLIWTVRDLRSERPDITIDEIAWLLGVTEAHAAQLLVAEVPEPPFRDAI